MEINETEWKNNRENQWSQKLVLTKINKVDKPLARLNKRKGRQIFKLGMEEGTSQLILQK